MQMSQVEMYGQFAGNSSKVVNNKDTKQGSLGFKRKIAKNVADYKKGMS